jgi:hypothetical protein
MLEEKREIILNFDFPQGVKASINEIMKEFYNETGWDIKLNEKINNNAANLLIKKLIDSKKIKKISFYPEKFVVQVFLNEKYIGDNKEIEIFKEKTGWELFLIDEETALNSNIEVDKLFFEVKDAKEVEQNIALSMIDKAFEGEEIKPYKKSIKNNGNKRSLGDFAA